MLAAVNTHGFPAVVTRCSNNYGPYQFPEKFVPLMIANAREDKPLPIYGDGMQERDWLHVDDHCEALLAVLGSGRAGEVYNISGRDHRANLEIARLILSSMRKPESLIRFVEDRPGHDRRYAPDASKIETEMGWKPRLRFEEAMPATVRWYDEHRDWLERVRSGEYRDYYRRNYSRRLDP